MDLAETALEMIVGVLGCEPISHDCYFLTFDGATGGNVQSPHTVDFADVSAAGPWDEVFFGKVPYLDVSVASLSPELQQFAERHHHTAIRCVPVRASHGESVIGCLVAWDRKDRPLVETGEATFRYAAEIASLALGRARLSATGARPKTVPWPQDVDVVTGLPLEEALVRSLDEMIASGQRPGLICVRLTALEDVRRRLGDFTSDQLIRVSARRVNSLIRMTDEVYRTGPDGLAIVCTGALDDDRLEEIAGRVSERLGVPFRVDAESTVDVVATVSSLQSPEEPIGGAGLLAAVRALTT
jgi:GGDEF domain-containing protein